jgi:hypothetical protein
LLMPVFGPLGIRKMFPEMMDVIGQMLLSWDRFVFSSQCITHLLTSTDLALATNW